MSETLHNIPAVEGGPQIGREGGEKVYIAGVHLTRGVKAADSAFAFCINELSLQPEEGVPSSSSMAKTSSAARPCLWPVL
ncbi:MAG: hypothetical protein JO108_04690 [Acidobacteriaceae bacterium]|nr:hypothetical protein [Acidobacteriaceae bacterium]